MYRINVAILAIIIAGAISIGAISNQKNVSESSQNTLKGEFLNGSTASGATTDSLDVDGRPLHTFYVSMTGASTVTPQVGVNSVDGTTVHWFDLNSITSTGVYAYPLVDSDKLRIILDGNTGTVSVYSYSRNR